MQTQEPFVLGVNYWPRKKAMYWWKHFSQSEVEAEFNEIAALQLSVVRIFLLWEDFQPRPDMVDKGALTHLGMVLDCAQKVGLKVMITFFTGFMSGVSWWPAWALASEKSHQGGLRIANGQSTMYARKDPYTDPLLLSAQQLFVRSAGQLFGQHPALYAWDWGNEHDVFFRPETCGDGLTWLQLLREEIRQYSTVPITFGQHLPMLMSHNGFRPDLLRTVTDILSMHAYSIYYEPVLDDEPLQSDLVPLACLVTEALGRKPVLCQEFGYASSQDGQRSEFIQMPDGTPQSPRQYVADDVAGGQYYREVLEKLVRCGASGALAWVFSDYDASLWHLPPLNTHPHERFFGLTRADGTLKPSAEAMRDMAVRIKEGQVPERAIAPLQIDPVAWYTHPRDQFDTLFCQLRGHI